MINRGHWRTVVSRVWAPALVFLVFLAAITAGSPEIQTLSDRTLGPSSTAIPYAFHIGAWLTGAFLVNRLVDAAIWEMLVAHGTSIEVPKLLRQLSAVIIFGAAIFGIMGVVFAQSITGLLTTSTALGLLIGFAVRSLILDAMSGIAINLEQPFRAGQFIQVRGRGSEPIMGRVQEVNLRTTRLLTLEDDLLIIPNGMLAESIILNRSVPNTVTWFEQSIRLDFIVESDRALRVLTAAAHSAVAEGAALANPGPTVLLDFIDGSVSYRISYAIDPTKTSPRRARHTLLKHVTDSLHHAGMTPAIPKRDMFVARMPDRARDYEDMAHRAMLLSRIDLFSEFDRAALDMLASQAQVRPVPAGGVVIEQDDDKDPSMFVVVEGSLGVRVRGSDGVSREVGHLKPGAFFGEMSVLTGEKRSATVHAIGDAVLYEFTKDHIASLLDSNPKIAAILSRTVAERQMRNSAAMAQLPPEARAEQQKNLVDQLMRSMTSFFGRIFRAA